MDKHNRIYKASAGIAPASSSFAKASQEKPMSNTESNVEPVNKNLGKVNNPKPGNLIPTSYNQFMFIMLSDQKKWNRVFEKQIELIDRLDIEKEFWNLMTWEEAEEFLYYEEVMLLAP